MAGQAKKTSRAGSGKKNISAEARGENAGDKEQSCEVFTLSSSSSSSSSSVRPMPRRICLPDFSGRVLTLPDGPESWQRLGEGPDALVLGLGPGCPWLAGLAQTARRVCWLEHEPTLRALPPLETRCDTGMPQHWQRVQPEEAAKLAAHSTCYFYGPGMRLAPDFWGPLMGQVDAALLQVSSVPAAAPQDVGGASGERRGGEGREGGPSLLPGHDGLLLHQELHQALDACGLGPVMPLAEKIRGPEDFLALRHVFRQQRPRLFLSVNLRGLDAEGRIFHLCRNMGVPVVLWLVDNPWHVLSALRLPWWREAFIFVTDASFVPGLISAGARHVSHLPLAVAGHMWRNAMPEHAGGGPEPGPLFVGRSSFPHRERFFAAARVPKELEAEASGLLERSSGPMDAPNYFWWQQRLGAADWPGMASRNAGLGAETCARGNRARWLRAIMAQAGRGAGRTGGDHARPPLRIVGDADWHTLLPGAQILPPVDYYATLPDLYASAGAVLNVTSLLLPQSLSQRHFDVWAAGGTLFSDATPGLDIFPSSLAEPVRLRGPEDFWTRWDEARTYPARIADLRRAWREHLRNGHCYEHRVRRICEVAGIMCSSRA